MATNEEGDRFDAAAAEVMDRVDLSGLAGHQRASLQISIASLLSSEFAACNEARLILASGDFGSLPNDWTLPRIADARMDDMRKMRDQVRDTCKRAEKAEAALAAIRADLDTYHRDPSYCDLAWFLARVQGHVGYKPEGQRDE